MFGKGVAFLHWSYRCVGDDETNARSADLLRGLFAQRRLGAPRARLFRDGAIPAVRQALLFDLGCVLRHPVAPDGLRALWLVEEHSRKVFLYGTGHLPRGDHIEGKLLRDVPCLDPAAQWWRNLTVGTSAGVLGIQRRGSADLGIANLGEWLLLIDVECRLFMAALNAFLCGLDESVLAAVQAEGGACVEAYNHYWGADGRMRRNRVEAALSFPWFADALRENWHLRCCVDKGAPTVTALAERCRLQPRTIRSTRTLAPELVAKEQRALVLRRLDGLSAEYQPKCRADWHAFLRHSDPLAGLAALLHLDLRPFLKPFAGGWEKGCLALSEKLGSEVDVAPILEMMQGVYRFSVLPLVRAELVGRGQLIQPPEDPPAAYFPLWFGARGLARLAELARDWQRAHTQFSLDQLGFRARDGVEALSWPALCRPDGSNRSHRVVELTSYQALDMEGRAMGHCVASYAVKCLLGESAIFSIRDCMGKPLSTFEVGLQGNVPVLVQQRGPFNADPSAEMQALARRFVACVLAPMPRERVSVLRAGRRSAGGVIRGRLPAPNTAAQPLSPAATIRFARALAFAHPPQARDGGLLPFIEGHGGGLPHMLGAGA